MESAAARLATCSWVPSWRTKEAPMRTTTTEVLTLLCAMALATGCGGGGSSSSSSSKSFPATRSLKSAYIQTSPSGGRTLVASDEATGATVTIGWTPPGSTDSMQAVAIAHDASGLLHVAYTVVGMASATRGGPQSQDYALV